jgi:hypothetical protein
VTIEQVLAARPSLSWRGLETVAFGPFGLKGAPDHFFRNERGKRFVGRHARGGMEDKATGFGFGVRAADLTGDGRVDVYVANDSDPNYLYRNEGGGVFKEIATWSGAALDENGAAQASMGLALGRRDGDGIPDLFTDELLRRLLDALSRARRRMFEDVSKASGVGAATFKPLSWGTAFADLDNDGALDLLVANGHIYPQIDSTRADRHVRAEDAAAREQEPAGPAALSRRVGRGRPGPRAGPRLSGDGDRRLRQRRPAGRPADEPRRPARPPPQRGADGLVADRRLRRAATASRTRWARSSRSAAADARSRRTSPRATRS